MLFAGGNDISLPAFTSGAAVTGNTFSTGLPTGLFVVGAGVNDTLSNPQAILDLAVADFDLDGDLDYAALRADGVVEVRDGDGAGNFSLLDVSGALTGATALAVGRMGTDAYPDLVVVHDKSISVFLNDGTGAFGAAPDSTQTQAASNGHTGGLVLVDYDRDGLLDVVVGDKNGGNRTLLGRRGLATGALSSVTQTVVVPVDVEFMASADVDSDGFTDILYTEIDGGVLFARGNGTFFVAPQVDVVGDDLQHLTPVDLNRDAFPDVVIVDRATDEYESLSSDGRAAPNLSPAASAAIAPGALTKTEPREIVAGDWNGDGKPDVVIAHKGVDGIVVRLGDGTLTLPTGAAATEYDTTGVADPDQIVAGDFNRDGDTDVLVTSSNSGAGVVRFLPGDGEANGGGSTVSAVQLVPWARNVAQVGVGDFDLDGHPDIFATSAITQDFQAFLNDGDAVSFSAAGTPVGLGTGSKAEGVVVTDFNRDGLPDVVLVAGQFVSMIGNGDGTFAAPVPLASIGSNPQDVAVADLNGDGILDAAFPELTSNTVQVVRGNGAGFDALLAGDSLATTSGGPSPVRIGDVNNDGLPDLFTVVKTGNGSPSVLDVFLNQGGFAFTRVSTTLTQLKARGMDVGDINRDGVLDVVVLSGGDDLIEILEGNGDGTFTNRGTITALSGRNVALLDLDKDGDLDLIQTGAGAGGAQSYANTNPAAFTFGAAQIRTGPASPENMAFGDMNRDGEIDLVAASDLANGGMQLYFGE